MADAAREIWITGIGIVSSLGEGADATWAKLNEPPAADLAAFAPFAVHPLAPLELDKQIPKKGDQRQMEALQRIGTYAAGLALDSAGVKGNTDLLGRMDMIVASGGGERDTAVDEKLLTGLLTADNAGSYINNQLMNELRPTLFLAQLPNLLAGNISIVHGVIGSSRTFMGEEGAGIDTARIAYARIAAGQSDIVLLGSAHNGERKDLLLQYAFGNFALKDKFAPVWDRSPAGGFALGSMGASLVLESREHAQRRGAKPIARLAGVLSDRSRRAASGDVGASLERMWGKLAPKTDGLAVISGATGAEPATAEERAFLGKHLDVPVRATGSWIGHGLEAQFLMNLAIAATAVSRANLFGPGSGAERPMSGALSRALVTGVGHWRGEGMALIEAAKD